MKKVFIPIIAAAVILAGCEKNPAGVTEQVSVTEVPVSEITAASVSESVTEESTAKAVEEAPAETEAEKEVFEIKVTPADEVYEVYPKRIIYPEKSETNITAKKAEITERFEKGGASVNVFSAVYPVFSGGDEAAVRKINEYIKNYVDEIYNELKQEAENYVFEDGFSVDEFPYNLCGFLYERSFTAGDYHEYRDDWDYDVNGNILSVYFEDYSYGAGAAHGYETPVPMVFDLRSGERVDFNKIIADADGLSEALSKALFDYRYTYNYTNSAYRSDDADKYAKFNEERINKGFRDEKFIEFGTDEEGNYIAVYCPVNDRIIIKDGCLSFYLSPYQYGSYADGIRRVDLPINDILPYLNEAGKSLFDGCVSAESEPLNIIEYRGGKHFSTESSLEFADREITEEDYDYISEFENVAVEFSNCTGIDYERLAELDNIFGLELESCCDIDFAAIAKMKGITGLILRGCEFDDISPLYGSGVKNIYEADYQSKFKSAENITISQWREFINAGGEYIDWDLLCSETTEYKGLEYTLTTYGIEIQDRDITDTDYEFISLLKDEDFPFLYCINFTHCGNIDYKKLLKHDDIDYIIFKGCSGIELSVPEELNAEDMLQLSAIEFIGCKNIDYEGLSGLDSVTRLEFTGCENIDLEAVAKMKNINYIDMTGCTYDDITVLYDSNINAVWVNNNMVWHKDTGYK